MREEKSIMEIMRKLLKTKRPFWYKHNSDDNLGAKDVVTVKGERGSPGNYKRRRRSRDYDEFDDELHEIHI